MTPDGDRAELAAAILRAAHRCIECGELLGAPVWDEGEWIPESFHWPWCQVLADVCAAARERDDIVDALARAGYGVADYAEPVPRFADAVG